MLLPPFLKKYFILRDLSVIRYRWFSRYVKAAMLVDENKRFLISSFCSSTSNCTLQHCYLCPWRLIANHLLFGIVYLPISNALYAWLTMMKMLSFFKYFRVCKSL